MNSALARNLLIALTSALAAAILTLGLEWIGLFHYTELKTYDGLFYVKNRVRPVEFRGPGVMVGIDDATYADPQFKIPMIFWNERLSLVILSLVRSGAKVVALDYMLPSYLFDDIIPDYSKTWLRTFATARAMKTPVITGYVEFKSRMIYPNKNYLQIIGRDNLGLFNLTTDSDDFIRRHKLWFRSGQGKGQTLTFPWAVAKAYDPDISPPSDTIFIDYMYPFPAFPYFSLSQVYARARQGDMEFMRENFNGKIVFIGSYDSLSQDRHSSPLNYMARNETIKIPGVEIHSQIVNTLLSGDHFIQPGPRARFALFIILAFAAGLSVMLSSQRLVWVALVGYPLAYVGGGAVCFVNYLIPPVVAGTFSILSSWLFSFGYRHYVQDKEKRKLRNLFQRYLQPDIVQRLLSTRETDFFKGENKRLCILFSDIRNFTGYAESRTPAVVVERLNEYFEDMSQEVAAEGGIVDKFLGDGMLAFFGALPTDENPSLAGARAALRMLDRLKLLNEEWRGRGDPPFKIGIGLHSGVVMVGNIGSSNKTEFTVIGDTVNLASRLQEQTKVLGADILISQAVCEDIKDDMDMEETGVVKIRGRSPEKTYRLKGIRRLT